MKKRFNFIAAALTLMGALSSYGANIVYVNEAGQLTGYSRPEITDAKAALQELATPPAGQQLGSAIPAGTTLLGIKTTPQVTIVNFSSELVAGGLDEARNLTICEQVRGTLASVGVGGSVQVQAAGRRLTSYLPVLPKVQGAQSASAPTMNVVGLAGKEISLSPGHGLYWTGSGWTTARPVYCSPLNQEDYHNLQIAKYLDTYLAQDGATVRKYRCFDLNYGTYTPSGHAWWHMAANYWTKQTGYPCSVYASSSGDCTLASGASESSDAIRAGPVAANYDATQAHIALHSNGLNGDCSGSTCPNGTCTYFDSDPEHAAYTIVSSNLAKKVQASLISAIRTKYTDSTWRDRGALDAHGAYAETRVPDRPAILIELAFHDSCDRDAVYLRDNFFRSTTMWATYKGICDYFGVTPTWDYYSYEVVSHTIPTALAAGAVTNVQITLRNRGVLWNDTEQFRLGAVGDSDPFSATTRFNVGTEVDPNETITFTVTLTAPSTPGSYTTDWRMVREGVTWFGPTVSQTINVTGAAVPPSITSQPASQTVDQGSAASFSVTATGTAPLGYQWTFNSVNISGATASTYSRSNVQPVDAGNYAVVVSNSAGSVTSADAALTVNTNFPPTITTQPASQSVALGANVTFSVTASGTAPFTYQWKFNGGDITGATASSLTKSSVQSTDAGSYSVVVANAFGTATSANAVLTVNSPPTLSLGTSRATETVVTFETITDYLSDHVMFRKPLNSGSTSSFLDTVVTNYTLVATSFPTGNPNGSGSKVLKAGWTFKTGTTNAWLRLTTINSTRIPNPVFLFGGRIKFDIYADKSLKLAVGLRETGGTAAVGGNGGSTGAIEWVGVTGKNGAAPICTRTINAATWTTVEVNLPAEPCENFNAGNSVLDGERGVLEHLAIVPNAGLTSYTIYLDNFQMIMTNTLPAETVNMNTGAALTFTASSTDPDSGQTRTYSLDTGAPAGASINSTSGAFTWTPTAAGTNSVTVRATDNGTPAQSDAKTITVVVSTDPLGVQSPESMALVESGEGATLTWAASPGTTYQVQYKQDNGEWTNLGSPIVADSAEGAVQVSGADQATSYRILEVNGTVSDQ